MRQPPYLPIQVARAETMVLRQGSQQTRAPCPAQPAHLTCRYCCSVPTALLEHVRSDALDTIHECPLLCFVNARSGGRKGSDLALALSRAIGRVQVNCVQENEGYA
jgi:hypothetical protein